MGPGLSDRLSLHARRPQKSLLDSFLQHLLLPRKFSFSSSLSAPRYRYMERANQSYNIFTRRPIPALSLRSSPSSFPHLLTPVGCACSLEAHSPVRGSLPRRLSTPQPSGPALPPRASPPEGNWVREKDSTVLR